MDQILYGAAYYDEYMPVDRLDQDIEMMKQAGINVVRIAESTWSTYEPQDGVFDFSHVERVMDAMEAAGISVIIGTPTYAVPTWMVKAYPDVLATTVKGRGMYGPRQIMDITSPVYLYYAERIIRKLMACTAKRKCVIGYQLDNETKYYGTAGKNVQERFVKYLRNKFHNSLEDMNRAFGLDYWSNRINAWEDFPDVRGTINGSLGAEFEKFQRSLVTEFLGWQSGIAAEYKREDQFITQNFDFEWRGYSYGVQPDVDHYQAAKCLSVAGTDIYHPTQDDLTGAEIAFGGDSTRSLKQDNYLVLETEAQGFPCWVPYPGQLRLQAYSHLASGANSVMYWHWHSIHNSMETFWKGLLSHDFKANASYLEAGTIGRELKEIGSKLVNLKKQNRTAILVSNESLTALKWFPIDMGASMEPHLYYNDVVRWIYDVLYKSNIECDFLFPESNNLEQYQVLIVPALYSAPAALLERINSFVEQGGHLITTFKSGFTDENVQVRTEQQPGILSKCLGVNYSQFTFPKDVWLKNELSDDGNTNDELLEYPKSCLEVSGFMELLKTDSAKVIMSYDHPAWKDYAAVTWNQYGKGTAVYIGCMTSPEALKNIIRYTYEKAGLWTADQQAEFPVIIRSGINQSGANIRYYFNYSSNEWQVEYQHSKGQELLSGSAVEQGALISLSPWGIAIVESEQTN
ncbi:beta-galactosidase [uncultured Robinsoniella sp.]|uniref:beta-galactosidase n=1 Tax=uncultured Robinsoniella sp. TaxID=904190 RepID=UPI00374F752C